MNKKNNMSELTKGWINIEIIELTVTTSEDTMTTKWLIGRDYFRLYARPEAAWDYEGITPAFALDVTHEATFEGSQDQWIHSIAERVKDAFEALKSSNFNPEILNSRILNLNPKS